MAGLAEVMWFCLGEKRKRQKEVWKWEKEKGIQCDEKVGFG